MAEERIQKIMAEQGLCSRRAAEQIIAEGRVKVNGHPVKVGDKMDPNRDVLHVDDERIYIQKNQQLYYLALYKPRGYVTTLADERGRATAAELVADCDTRVFPVGRLDRDSEGLLLMTNDGALAQAMLHPRGEVDKVYQVTVSGTLERSPERLSAIRMLDGERIRPAKVEILRRWPGQALLEITIHEGKNRQIRRMCRQVGLNVLRLQRVREHTLSLGHLKPGKWRYLTEAEIRTLKRSLHYEP